MPGGRCIGTSRSVLLLLAVSMVLVACSGGYSTRASRSTSSTSTRPTSSVKGLPPIRHVFVIVLENEGYPSTFGNPSDDPYLASTLPSEGALLENYYAIGHVSLDNYIALVSGQPPNSQTEGDCVSGFDDFATGEGQTTWDGASGVQEGSGCVYPTAVQTLVGQLASKGYTWKGYMEDMGNDPARDGAPQSVCGHPTVDEPDPAILAVPGDGYVTRHDPFLYFHSIIDDAAYCDSHVVPLGTPTGSMPASDTVGATGLAKDLESISTTPNFSFITPNVCDDGHDYPCTNQPAPGASALADIDDFLRTWVPLITSSPAFKKNGLLEVTFDEGTDSDTSACCDEQPGPTGVLPGLDKGPGGGRIGTVLISPFIKPGEVVTTPFNHYSSLASFEDLFSLPRLGYAQTVSTTFDEGVFDTSR